jgi:transcriptional regulator
MLVHPWDAPDRDSEWRAVLQDFGFGQLIAPGSPDRELPVVVPTHFTFDGSRTVELHLAKPNPVWRALAERPRALLTVVTDYVYVPAAVNADAGQDPALGVPTSYYAAVQVEVDAEIIDDPAAKTAILAAALNHFEPVKSPRVLRGVKGESDRLQVEKIRGLRLTITGVHAKFKYGGNKTVQHRREIAAALQARNGSMDSTASRRVLNRLPGPTEAWSDGAQRPDSHPGSL